MKPTITASTDPVLQVYIVGEITVVASDGSTETIHGALLVGDRQQPAAIQRAGALLHQPVELVAVEAARG